MEIFAFYVGISVAALVLAGALSRFGKPPKERTLDERLLLYLTEMKRHREKGTLTIQKRKELLNKHLPRRPKGSIDRVVALKRR